MTLSPSEHDADTLLVTYADIEAAAHRLEPVINKTPVHTSRTFNNQTGCEVFFQCEQLQRTGAFKFRGAYNALSRLTQEEKKQGVLTFSSGNHAQAIALAGNLLDIPTTIVMPQTAPAVKLEATERYGAEIVRYDPATTVREELAFRLAQETAKVMIPPSDHPNVIAGQGTVAKQLFETVGPLDMIITGCGGGGLLSGTALAAQTMAPNCKVVGVEPNAGDDATRSFHTGQIQSVKDPKTIAEGARTPSLSKRTFAIISELVSDMVTVSDEAIIRTMYFLWERMKLVVEPTGALAAAALFDGAIDIQNKRVGIILSGGNVDLKKACQLFERV